MRGFWGPVLGFLREVRNGSEIEKTTTRPHGTTERTPYHIGPPGYDAQPIESDRVFSVPAEATGRAAVAGYSDPVNRGTSGPGETILRARGASDAAELARLGLLSDGTVEIVNGNGVIRLHPDGASELTTPGGRLRIAADGTVELEGDTSVALETGEASVVLNADGTIEISGSAGSLNLEAGGTWRFNNGASVNPLGQLVTSLGIVVDFHTHLAAGTPTGPPQ